MPRYFLEISYIGTAYNGWQIQENAPKTIQAEINRVLSTILRQDIMITGSSRTDAGVHALQNFAHFDLETEPAPMLVHKLNFMLSKDIAIRRLFRVSPQINSRFAATGRSYAYHIHQRKDPFLNVTSCYYPYRPLDLEAMNDCCRIILEHRDFAAFSKRNTQVKTSLCTLSQATWEQDREERLVFRVSANRFLRGMVRGLVGTMLRVGRGKLTRADFQRILDSGTPHKTDFSAPANGLTLLEVRYNWPDILWQEEESA